MVINGTGGCVCNANEITINLNPYVYCLGNTSNSLVTISGLESTVGSYPETEISGCLYAETS